MDWKVYIIRCSDDSFYTGITNDLEKRFAAHSDQTGAKYFRGRRPEEIIYIETGHNRSSASKREILIKKLSREHKKNLIASALNAINLSFYST